MNVGSQQKTSSSNFFPKILIICQSNLEKQRENQVNLQLKYTDQNDRHLLVCQSGQYISVSGAFDFLSVSQDLIDIYLIGYVYAHAYRKVKYSGPGLCNTIPYTSSQSSFNVLFAANLGRSVNS